MAAPFIYPAHWLRGRATLRDVHATEPVRREFIRVTGGQGGSIRNVSAPGCGDCVSPHLPTGIKFQDGGTDWTVTKAVMRGFRMVLVPGKYPNGDGFATEHPNARIRFDTCKAIGNGDGGFDLKGPDGVLHNCAAIENPKNFRFWSSLRATGKLISQNPRSRDGTPGIHLHICPSIRHKERQVVEIANLYARGPGCLLRVETVKGAKPPIIVVEAHDVKGVTEIVRASGGAPEIIWKTGAPKL